MKAYYRPSERRLGISLIEVMLATVLAGLVLSGILFSYQKVQERSVLLSTSIDSFEAALEPIDYLRRDLVVAQNFSALNEESGQLPNGFTITYQVIVAGEEEPQTEIVEYRILDEACSRAGLSLECQRIQRRVLEGFSSPEDFVQTFPQVARVEWCLESADPIGACPDVDRVPTSSGRRLLLRQWVFQDYRSGATEPLDFVFAIENRTALDLTVNPSGLRKILRVRNLTN